MCVVFAKARGSNERVLVGGRLPFGRRDCSKLSGDGYLARE